MSNDILEKVGKKTPFTVPEGFFETMHSDIVKAVEKEQKRKHRATIITWAMSAAAAIAIALISFSVLQPSTGIQSTQDMLADNNSDTYLTNMSDEELDMWITLTNNDEFLNCDNTIETIY